MTLEQVYDQDVEQFFLESEELKESSPNVAKSTSLCRAGTRLIVANPLIIKIV